jgi:hypothetical protein
MALNVVVTQTGLLFTLDEAKAHLRVETGDDDALIGLYSNAAVSHVLQYCNLALVPDDEAAIAAFKAAALLVLGDLYANREPAIAGTITTSRTIWNLLAPYRWLRV